MPPNRVSSNVDALFSSAYLSDDDSSTPNAFAFKEQHCFNCFVLTSEIDNCLMQCGKCHKFYYCGMDCFNAHLKVHMQYCRTGKIYNEPERRAGTKSTVPLESSGRNMKQRLALEQSPEERRPSDRLWASFQDDSSSSSSDDESDCNSEASVSGSDCESACNTEQSIVESFVGRIEEEGSDDLDASWSDTDEEIQDESVSLIEDDSDEEEEEATAKTEGLQDSIGSQPAMTVHSTQDDPRSLPLQTCGSSDDDETKSVGDKHFLVEEDCVGASGCKRFAQDGELYEEGYESKGRGYVGGMEWETTEEISSRRGSAVIPVGTQEGIRVGRGTFGAPLRTLSQSSRMGPARQGNGLKPMVEKDDDWSSTSFSDSSDNQPGLKDELSYSKRRTVPSLSVLKIEGRKCKPVGSPVTESGNVIRLSPTQRTNERLSDSPRNSTSPGCRSLPQGQFRFLSQDSYDADNDQDVDLKRVQQHERLRPQFEKPEWSRRAPLRTTSKGEKARRDGDLRKHRVPKPEEQWEKPEWARKAPLRTSSRGARLKAGNSLRRERTGTGIQALVDDRTAPKRTSSRDPPVRSCSNSSNNSKRNTSAMIENVRIEKGQFLWESPRLRKTVRGSLLHRQQSIRNSKFIGKLPVTTD